MRISPSFIPVRISWSAWFKVTILTAVNVVRQSEGVRGVDALPGRLEEVAGHGGNVHHAGLAPSPPAELLRRRSIHCQRYQQAFRHHEVQSHWTCVCGFHFELAPWIFVKVLHTLNRSVTMDDALTVGISATGDQIADAQYKVRCMSCYFYGHMSHV